MSKKYKKPERKIDHVPFPETRRLSSQDVYKNGKLKPEVIMQHYIKEGRLEDDVILHIIHDAAVLLSNEPNLLSLNIPITICGDTHGQFYDLVKLLEIGGSLEKIPYLFLGDYVDRGCFGVEIITYLYALKINHPKNIYLLRGNHESRLATANFTFRNECILKHSLKVYTAFTDSFDALPLAACVNNQFFCTHGGLSPQINVMEDVNKINRFQEPPVKGPMCDLLWSDPCEDYGLEKSEERFLKNKNRGCSFFYSYTAVCNFLDRNNLLSVIRGHEAQEAGYHLYKKNVSTGFPSLLTIFSAPNYLDAYNNKAAVISFTSRGMLLQQFEHSPHPFWLPSFIDGFSWSLPFLVEKATEMFTKILEACKDSETPYSVSIKESTDALTNRQKREIIRNKIKAVGTMGSVLNMLKDNQSLVLPKSSDPNALEREGMAGFDQAKYLDRANEMLPKKPRKSSRRSLTF